MTELPVTFGKYFLTEKLATGGMAEIYLGKLLGPGGFEKQLVIKQIHPRLAAEPHFVDLFVAEAKTLVGLTHGNIVPVYELGIVDDTYFIAMEYIDGPTLWQFTESAWAAGDAIAPAVSTWVASEILDGLDYAHRKGEGVIHRDLSPRNVMLSRDGQVLLVDFGIAVPFGAGDDPAADGAPTGSFPYMSPEQVERRRLTTASDLFSVSVLLWEMLAGQRLFARPDADATLAAVLGAPIPPPSSLRPAVPARLDEVVLRGLEREPEKRWPSAGDFLAALNRHLYTLEDVPTARDLAALVARHCPPVSISDEAEVVKTAIDAPTRERGPGTVVVPRRSGETPVPVAAVAAAGKPVVREQSFATHVEIDRVFGATPIFPFRAISDEDDADRPEAQTHVAPMSRPGAARSAASAADVAVTAERPRELPPSQRSWLPAAAIGAAITVLVFWFLTRTSPPATVPDAGVRPRIDAGPVVVPTVDGGAPPDAPRPVIADAAVAPDASMAIDAGPRPPRDAGPRPPRADAGVPRPDAGTPRATGTVKVGADPWGEVSIDGRKVGNAPGQWAVPVGGHDVVVVYPGVDGEQREKFRVEVDAGETESVFATFDKD